MLHKTFTAHSKYHLWHKTYSLICIESLQAAPKANAWIFLVCATEAKCLSHSSTLQGALLKRWKYICMKHKYICICNHEGPPQNTVPNLVLVVVLNSKWHWGEGLETYTVLCKEWCYKCLATNQTINSLNNNQYLEERSEKREHLIVYLGTK